MSATVTSRPLTAEARKKLIAERTQRSAFWRTIHILASLKLALLLLITIAIACAIATFYESSFNAKIARAYIYKAPWFVFWLGVLCVNLAAVTISRWPWQKKHTGFIVTHYGIILLLVGAIIGSRFGFEGNVTLHRDGPVSNMITTSESAIQFDDLTNREPYLVTFDADLARPTESRPVVFQPPGFKVQVVVDGYSDSLEENQRLVPSPSGGAGVEMKFSTQMMGQSLSMPFVLRPDGGMDRDFFGLATISFLPRLPDRNPPTVVETRMVFANYAPIGQGDGGKAALDVRLSSDGTKLTAALQGGATQDFPVKEKLGGSFRAGDSTVQVLSYWPDFKLENGVPASASDQPNNPAVLVRVTGPAATEPTGDSQPHLEMAPRDGGMVYQLSRGGQVYASGAAKVGEPFKLGWADWTADLTTFLPHAAIATDYSPGPAGTEGIPGFRAHLRDPNGATGESKWVASGAVTTFPHGDSPVRVAYGLRLREVPFTIRLKDFQVPRLEGTETPANFIATVEFRDAKTGQTKSGVARMNHPASWPGDPLALVTGLNYKFSQAQWNPKDLGETTLQVLYDPGWLLKWVGSLAICAGIFIMFYIRPGRKTA